MPSKSQMIEVEGFEMAELAALAYGSFLQLGWTVKYAAASTIIAYTPKSWSKYDERVTVGIEDKRLTVKSEMIHGESFDMMGKNAKHIAAFLDAFNRIKSSVTPEQVSEWQQKISLLEQETQKEAVVEMERAGEISKVMNPAGSRIYVTYAIMAINVLVFAAMAASGVSILEPTNSELWKWGANFLPLTATGEEWRLITNVFVHIGIIHILFNMYALYMIGIYLEPMLGKTRYLAAYICTGIIASIGSLLWHHPPVTSAGASGAIFGMYGVFLALLTTKLIPHEVRTRLLQSIGIFVVYNLAYGMKAGVDNAAHIGGLVSGFVIGYLYYPALKHPAEGSRKNLVPAIITVVTLIIAFMFLQNESKKVDPEQRRLVKNMIASTKFKDGNKFLEKIQEFGVIEQRALAPLNDTSLTDIQLIDSLNTTSTAEWKKAGELVNEMEGYSISATDREKLKLLTDYIDLRKQQIPVLVQILNESTDSTEAKNKQLVKEIDGIIEKLNHLQ